MNHGIVSRTHTFALFFVVVLLSLSVQGRAQSTTDPARHASEWTTANLSDSDPSALENPGTDSTTPDSDKLPDAPQAAQTATSAPAASPTATDSTLNTGQQTKRILFIIPNFRAVSVDEKLPPLTAKEEIKLVLQDSFDYSSFIYVGIVAGIGQGENSYPEFGQGAAGYGRY